MLKYAKIINVSSGRVILGSDKDSEEYNASIGMKKLNVWQSDIDDNWYLYDRCPLKLDATIAEENKTYLKEQVNYAYKAKVAYTGVYTTYQGKDVIFETNKDSITLITSTLLSLSAGAKSVKDWKFREVEVPHNPVSIDLTALQFQTFVAFGQTMISQAFMVESQINAIIDSLDASTLCNKDAIKALEQQIEQAYAKVPVRLDIF